uniref:Zinc knuckle CX2CX4HX4C domain-containing protein n=1 Tax=Cannabis sativa TaxID=3483 RepID=A0A803PFX8_CANSA
MASNQYGENEMETEYQNMNMGEDEDGFLMYEGKFQKTDPNDFKGVWRDYLRVRVSVCVDAPLKKRMRLQMKNGPICNVKFKYEDLTTLAFVCVALLAIRTLL